MEAFSCQRLLWVPPASGDEIFFTEETEFDTRNSASAAWVLLLASRFRSPIGLEAKKVVE